MTQTQTPVELSAFEWFNKLKEPWRSQAIKASKEQPAFEFRKETYKSLHDAVGGDFAWYLTPLHVNGWMEIHESLMRGETTYLADDSDDVKSLSYWQKNAEEDYMTTPISVLRYITELERIVFGKLPEPPKQ